VSFAEAEGGSNTAPGTRQRHGCTLRSPLHRTLADNANLQQHAASKQQQDTSMLMLLVEQASANHEQLPELVHICCDQQRL
jgi:hypothetical protein